MSAGCATVRAMRTRYLLLSSLLLAACGEVASKTPDASLVDAREIDSGGGGFTVGGTVSGFAGSGLILQLNGGADLEITDDGAFTFPGALEDDTAYTVTVASDPSCPLRLCSVDSGTGTIAGADVTDVAITCEEASYRLGSQSWGEDSVRVTDDLLSIADNGTASPRILVGANTGLGSTHLDSLALDPVRDLIYAPAQNGATVNVWADASTVSGNLAPHRQISVAGETGFGGIEVDYVRDRLYVSGNANLYVFDNASTLGGTVTATAVIPVPNAETVSLDRVNDRLYVGGDYSNQLFIFDGASTLTSSSTAVGTASWTTATGMNGPTTLAIDGCRDRLYLGSNAATPGGFNVVVFDNASNLNGAINHDTDSQARIDIGQCISGQVDAGGRLYCWPDSPTLVRVFEGAEAWTGVVTPTPTKTINGVVSSGYGLDVVPRAP